MDSIPQRPAPPAPSTPQAAPLPAGTVLASRFTLQHQAGRGGMGSVYRATDSLSGQLVALKLLHVDSSEALQRFSREAHVLASLRHPGIVSYVAHGIADDGRPFLAMEWLEGEDLAQRLSRQPLSLKEALPLLRNAAQALALAHQHGVIHRDLKPSNLFLRHGRPEEVVLLDFGLARHLVPSQALTARQMVLGTPGYMAPEQASSQPVLTPSADIFSLGCVLYECLTGKPPFSAPHFVAALAKILFAEPEPLRSLRPELPTALEELLKRMLAKAPERRLPDASSLLAALAQWESGLGAELSTAAPSSAPALHLAEAEQLLVSVLLAAPHTSAQPLHGSQDSQRSLFDALRTLLTPHGAQVELLTDGSLVTTLVASHGSATDPATLAARCALLIQERWPGATVVLTTGRGRLDQHLPVGDAMDRAGQLLRQSELLPGDPSSALVVLDEVTAGLLGSGFQLSRIQPGLFQLSGEIPGLDTSRPLLGKPTSCVGREQELTLLELAFNACVQEPMAHAVLVKAPAGTGKSRLRHEFLRRLERQGQPVQVLLGRGDPMSAGSADGLLAQALRRLCGLSGAEPLEVRREHLTRRLAQHLPVERSREVVEFLGELCGIPFPDAQSSLLRTARGDPHLMSTQVGRALVAFLRAECAHHPVLLILEDLHWGDVLSVRLMDEALRELAEQPFMVLALARPELDQLFPAVLKRWQEVPLRGLSRKAGARLVHEVLGPDAPDSLVERLIEQSAGNALFLEELIRGAAEGRGEAAPQTVLAMLQARLMRLEPEARQVLLAASFLGRSFWPGAVQSLLGEELSAPALQRWLRRLVELELVEPQLTSRFPAQDEYRFRHALVRDAAYELVPDRHKPMGHRLAGQWLEQAGESDPLVLAEHARLGQQPERAIPFYDRAAWQFFDRHDMQGMERCVETAMTLSPAGETLVQLQALQAIAAFWKGQFARLFELGQAVLPKLRQGSLPWYWLAHELYLAHAHEDRRDQPAGLEQALLSARPEAKAQAACLEALCMVSCMCIYDGARKTASAFMARLAELGSETAPGTPLLEIWSTYARSLFAFYFEAQPWQACLLAEQTYRSSLELGLVRGAMTIQVLWGQALEALGDRAGAERQFRENLALCQQSGQFVMALYSGVSLGQLLAGNSEPARRQEALSLTRGWEEVPIPIYAGRAYAVTARAAAGDGDLIQAETWARKACELLASTFFHLLPAQILLSQVLLAQGRATEAREVAALGVQRLEQCASEGAYSVGIRLALAEACLAEGDTQTGEAALRKALQCVHSRAKDIPDEAARERFLRQVPENARTLDLARQRWGE